MQFFVTGSLLNMHSHARYHIVRPPDFWPSIIVYIIKLWLNVSIFQKGDMIGRQIVHIWNISYIEHFRIIFQVPKSIFIMFYLSTSIVTVFRVLYNFLLLPYMNIVFISDILLYSLYFMEAQIKTYLKEQWK